MKRRVAALGILVGAVAASDSAPAHADTTSHAFYGTLSDGRTVDICTLRNANGVIVRFLSLGGCIIEVDTPDRHGRLDNVVLGHDDLAGYDSNVGLFGAIVGRYANRIAKGGFTLNGRTYHLPINDGLNSLHGGTSGFNLQLSQVTPRVVPHGVAAERRCTSPDGQDG